MDGSEVKTRAQKGVLIDMLTAWGDLRGSARDFIASRPSEPKLLMVAILSGLIFFFGTAVEAFVSPPETVTNDDEFNAYLGAALVGAAFFRTLGLYGFAAVAKMVLARFGGSAIWSESRAAVFWAALVAAPLLFAVKLLLALAPGLAGSTAGDVIGQAGGIAFAYVLAQCLAEASGFARPWGIFGGLVGITILIVILGALLQSGLSTV